jgi:hypothetical protein
MFVSISVNHNHSIRLPNKLYKLDKLQEQMIIALYTNQSLSDCFNHSAKKTQ